MSDNFAQLVKQQADIVRIIGDYLKLRKSGAQNYTGLCPFHKEKTGSFSVNATHGYFYCFGCHEKGDVFTFVMKMENISFPEAIRVVATKCGIPLTKREFSSPEEAHEAGLRRQLIDIHEAATQYFEAALKGPEAARAREYLTGRGVTPETIAKFRIGYAPDDFNHMREQLAKHFPDPVLRASGLFSSKEQADGGQGQLYARFRKRITFPIANEQGKTIAFTGRALDAQDEKGAEAEVVVLPPERKRMPKTRESITHKFSIAGHEGYITAGKYEDGSVGEIFLTDIGKEGSTLRGMMNAFATAISIGLQYGVPLEAYVEKFTNMRFEPAGMTDDSDIRMAQSVMDYIFRRLALDHLPYDQRAELGILSAAERAAQLAGQDPAAEDVDLNTVGSAATAAGAHSTVGLLAQQQGRQVDAPLCLTCGTKMRPAGSCYVCEGCGATSGCS